MSGVNRNVRGGKNYKKMKSGNVRHKSKNPDLPVDTSTGVDFYAVVTKRLGDNRLLVKLDTGVEVQAVIPGRFRRKVWFNAGDYIQVKSVGDDFYDIVQKIVNENEHAKAHMAINKKENASDDIFMPGIQEESEPEDPELDKDDGIVSITDAFGNKKDIKLNKSTTDANKLKLRKNEKIRDQSRREATRNYDIKPTSLIEDNSEDSESSESSESPA